MTRSGTRVVSKTTGHGSIPWSHATQGDVLELVDMPVLETGGATRAGSTPAVPTT